jgi:hypothetical protein
MRRLERVPYGVLAVHYEIRGRVLQQTDQTPLAGLRVEGRVADFGADDFLGTGITGPNGEFVIEFDESRYREWIGDDDPDVYFHVYRCGELTPPRKDRCSGTSRTPRSKPTSWSRSANLPQAGPIATST